MKNILINTLFLFSYIIGYTQTTEIEYADIIVTKNRLHTGNVIINGRLDRVPTNVILGNNNNCICLQQNDSVIVGFTDNFIFNKKGEPDLFIKEIGYEDPKAYAKIFVSSNNINYTYIGNAFDNKISEFNFENFGILDTIRFVKIASYHPIGFDLTWIKGNSNQKEYCNIDELINKLKNKSPYYCTKIEMDNIQFATNSSELTVSAKNELKKIIKIMNLSSSIMLDVNGHTDNVGNEELNRLLSEQRAYAIYNFLITKGVIPSRLTYKGFGSTKPLKTNNTKKGRKKNRRVELFIRRL